MGFTKENKEKFTKRNKILHLTKQNETKRNEISQFILFRETSKISRNNFVVSLCFVFRETKKRMRNGNPNIDLVSRCSYHCSIPKEVTV
jgi:hypothetical protein